MGLPLALGDTVLLVVQSFRSMANPTKMTLSDDEDLVVRFGVVVEFAANSVLSSFKSDNMFVSCLSVVVAVDDKIGLLFSRT